MASELYAAFPENVAGGNTSGEGPIDLLSDTIKFSLRNAHTPDQTGDTVYGDLAADESSATGYTAGGITLGNKTYAVSSLTTTFDNTADLVWTISSGTLETDTGVLYDDTPTSPADPLILADAFGSQSVTGGDFTYTPHSSGLFAIAVAT
jgi:hypothetical protein